MKDFITGKGWGYVSTCMCTPKYDQYANAAYPEFEIGLSTSNGFRIKKGKMRNTISTGGELQFESTYNQFFQ